MVKLSVGIPQFKTPYIEWLPLESLCNQKNITFKWELIICEEIYCENENEYSGSKYVQKYFRRLQAAGCESIKVFTPLCYTHLENKWKYISNLMDRNSFGLVIQGSDDYSPDNRLCSSYELLTKGADIVFSDKTIFLDAKTFKAIQYRKSDVDYKGILFSYSSRILNHLDFELYPQGCSVDAWLFKSVSHRTNPKIMLNTGDNWETGFFTDGFNRISTTRLAQYDDPKPPFYKYDFQIPDKLKDMLSQSLINRSRCNTEIINGEYYA